MKAIVYLTIFILQHAARYLGNQEWVKADSLKTVENTAVSTLSLLSLLASHLSQNVTFLFIVDPHYHACGGCST